MEKGWLSRNSAVAGQETVRAALLIMFFMQWVSKPAQARVIVWNFFSILLSALKCIIYHIQFSLINTCMSINSFLHNSYQTPFYLLQGKRLSCSASVLLQFYSLFSRQVRQGLKLKDVRCIKRMTVSQEVNNIWINNYRIKYFNREVWR